ncbi:hypothetical protein BH09BAC1_BH09BAC1_12750 [soil metagenome]
MENFVTIKTFTYPHEIAVVRGRLESEGIETFVADELTAQTYNFYSNALGGIKLQVREYDVELALAILEEAGYPKELPAKTPLIWDKLWALLNFLPLINRLNPIYGFFILVAIICGFAVLITYLIIRPTTEEMLIGNNWCLDYIMYQDVRYTPHTVYSGMHLSLSRPSFCKESIQFDKRHRVWLPGFETEDIFGHWEIEGDYLVLTDLSAFNNVFERKFLVDEGKDYMTLTSDSTIIISYKNEGYTLPW